MAAICNRQSASSRGDHTSFHGHGQSMGWLLIAACWLLIAQDVMACPLCKEALFDPSQLHQRISTAKGYALSIGLLLLVPTSLIAGVAMSIIRSARRAQRISRQ